jgi:hypothetical protein
MRKSIVGKKINVSFLNSHAFSQTLIEIEFPILRYFKDNGRKWFYLWCDTDNEGSHRWLIFDLTDDDYFKFIQSKISLRSILSNSESMYCLDRKSISSKSAKKKPRFSRSLKSVALEAVLIYLPSPLSFFDPTLMPAR